MTRSLLLAATAFLLAFAPAVAAQEKVEVLLPSSATAPLFPKSADGFEPLTIEISMGYATGAHGFRGTSLGIDDLVFALRRERVARHERARLSEIPLVVIADRRTEFLRLAPILERCADPEVGMHRIYLATAPRASDPAESWRLLPIFIGDPLGETREAKSRGREAADSGVESASLAAALAAFDRSVPIDLEVFQGPFLDGPSLMALAAEARSEHPGGAASLVIRSGVALEEVVAAVDLLRCAGFHSSSPDGSAEIALHLRRSRSRRVEMRAMTLHLSERLEFASQWPRRHLDLGFAWLASHQEPEGFWDADGFMKRDDPRLEAYSEGRGLAHLDLEVTSLALLALLGAGETHKAGRHMETLSRGLSWLRAQESAAGAFVAETATMDGLRQHAIATLTMNEAYSLTRSPLFKDSACRSAHYLLAKQNGDGGWSADPAMASSDIETTLWAVLALCSARECQTDVGLDAIRPAIDFLKGAGAPPTTIALARFAGAETDVAQARLVPAVAGLVDDMGRPTTGGSSGRLFAALVTRRLGGSYGAGGESGRARIRADYRRQVTVGNPTGSWDPEAMDTRSLGRVGSTALAILALEADLHYGRVFAARQFRDE